MKVSELHVPPEVLFSHNSPVMIRRRDKRRRQTSSLNLKDLLAVGPTELIALAVRFDETRQDEAVLRVPLESGRLYDSHQFLQALQYLREQTKPAGRRATSRKKEQPPFAALTPIILSGSLTAIQEQRDDGNDDAMPEDITSELVLQANIMRQAAISRIRLQKKRAQIQKIVLPIICFSILAVLYFRTMADLRNMLLQLGYVKSCDDMPAYSPVCRLTEAALWWKYRDFVLHDSTDYSLLENRYLEAPFSMHTTLSQQLIKLEDLLDQDVVPKRSKPKPNRRTKDLRWLGETTVNTIVREAINAHLNYPKLDKRILDVGCGIGGTLYALLSDGFTSYRGISASAAEIHMARQLANSHHFKEDIVFEQKSFDEVLPANNYTAAVAIESLSYSRNLEATIDNIVKSLKSGGVLVIVDDIVYPDYAIPEVESMLRPSLLPHTFWVAAIEKTGCVLKEQRDLSLEYEVILGHDTTILQNPMTAWGFFALLFPWEHWLARRGNAASQRLLELQEERTQFVEMWKRRQVGHGAAASLSYHIYVCVKP